MDYSDARLISGAGGGKSGAGGGLNEDPDTLKSSSYAQVLDLLCEGEIVGLVDGLKSIYLNDTPIQNPDGTNNFTGVQYVTTTGTQSQPAVSGFDQVQNEIAVGIEARAGTPVVRTITNSNVSTAVVTVQFPSLTSLDNKGNLGGTSVQYAIDVQSNGGGFVEVVNQSITGKSSGAYERQHRIRLTGNAPWDIRLRRVSPDSTSTQINNKTFLKSYTEVVEAKLRYPNSALVGLRVDASQFKSIPTRGYKVRLLKIRIPTNATVDDNGWLTYSGSWDGNFKIAWCRCPAWAMYDVITSNRYGLGQFVPASMVDKWNLYSISRYSAERVPDGFGGTEPRFTCNIFIDNARDAFQWISDMASIFRAMPYWANGAVSFAQDAPADPAYLYHNGNVVDGRFIYQGSSAKARHTVALVTWNDPADMFRQKVEYVPHEEGIARYGVIEAPVMAIGCTSRGMANRVGRWLLYSEWYQTDVVTFKVFKEGLFCTPGSTIRIADQHRAGRRIGGRVTSAAGSTVTVDSLAVAPTLPASLLVAGADGVIKTYQIQSVSGRNITTTAPLSPVPPAQAPWVVTSSALEAKAFRVLAVEEADEGYEIVAIENDDQKYGVIENGYRLQPRTYTSLSLVPDPVTAVTLSESLYRYQNDVRAKITASWPAAANATAYRVRWRQADGNWVEATTGALDYEILDTIVTKYEVEVTAIGVFGAAARTATSASINALGKTAPPSNVTGFVATIDPLIGITLSWNPVPDLDADSYEIRIGSTWGASALVAQVAGTSLKVSTINGTSQTFLIRAIDTTGNYSAAAASVTTTLSAPPAPTGLTAQVIDNNVLLRWTASAGTLALDSYEVRRGPSFASATVVGRVKSTFSTVFETAAGTYTYWVVGVDIAGNYGTPTPVLATVAAPPDYQLLTNVFSTFSGTRSNAIVEGGRLYLPADTTETWTTHFTARSWASPQDQVNAGFPAYIQPTAASGFYEEVIDYGSTIAGCKIAVLPTLVTEIGTPVMTTTISVSNTSASGPWTDYAGQTEVFASNFRWVKVRISVTSSGGDDMISISSLQIKLDAKQVGDFGSVTVNASDVGGTLVNFGRPFVAVNSITLTPQGSTPLDAIYDFAGGPNPTSFRIYLFNSAGARVSGTVSWQARGY